MATGTYLQRPTQWLGAQWDGTDQTDVNSVLTAVGWSFAVDGAGNGIAHSPFGSEIPVGAGMWVLAGNGSVQFLNADQFNAQFVAGAGWAVQP